MTGMEAWSIVAPILAAHSVPYKTGGKLNLDALDEAYIIVYGALKEHDERRKQEGKNGKNDGKAIGG